MSENLIGLTGLSVLAIFAHPDDEGFGSGGTLAMLVAKGARITLVCATNGDVGEISDPALATPETLAQVRQGELRRAMAITGVLDVRFLGYRDSGMAGWSDNNHPASLHRADPSEVVGRVLRIIREVRPELVITHDPTGVYGHPDHLAVHQHTTQAFSLAADPAAYPEQLAQGLQPWLPRLLYYASAPRSLFRRMWQQMLDAGITPPFASREIDSLGCPDEAVTTVLDVSQFVDTKLASLRCHRTQMDPNGAFARLSPEVLRDFMSTEYYTLAIPQGAGKEADLLANL
jgi:LmbE family N-acetylglucosaminyl deacetylase